MGVRHTRKARGRWSVGGVVIVVLSILAITAGLAIGGHIAWFYTRLSTKGHALITKERALVRAAAVQPAATCKVAPPSKSAPEGLLEAPSIGLTAPVLAGTGNPQLDVAVGHLSTSVWPGRPGTSVLAAHDVSYFSHLNGLALGAAIRFVTPCRTYLYTVTARQVVKAGSPLYSDPSSSRLVLETCYPLNALFFTSHRYLVTADLARVVPSGPSVPSAPAALAPPRVPAAPALVAQGLDLPSNNVQMGTLQLGGSPAVTWQQSEQPVNDERSVIVEYNAAVRSAEQGEAGWWQQLAPTVPFPASWPLRYGQITGYADALTPTLVARGGTLTGAIINAGIQISGGPSPGYYLLHATMADERNTLIITGWQLTPGR